MIRPARLPLLERLRRVRPRQLSRHLEVPPSMEVLQRVLLPLQVLPERPMLRQLNELAHIANSRPG